MSGALRAMQERIDTIGLDELMNYTTIVLSAPGTYSHDELVCISSISQSRIALATLKAIRGFEQVGCMSMIGCKGMPIEFREATSKPS